MERTRSFFIVLCVSSLLFLVSCGENSRSTSSGTTPVTLTMSDQPPAGVSVLAFEVTVSSAVLQPGNISLLSMPTDIEVSRLEVETAFLNTLKAPAGTYSSIAVSFANPELTILNNSGSAIAGCGVGRVCELKPGLAQTTVTYSGTPFPLMINSIAPIGLVLDLDLMNSIQADLSVSPAVTLTRVSMPPGSDHWQDIDDIKGEITAVDTGKNQFTVQIGGTAGRVVTVSVDERTEFEDFDEAGLTNAFASMTVGQLIEVDTTLTNDGSLVAKEVELEDHDDDECGFFDGVVVSTHGATQFTMVVTDETRDVAGLQVGNAVLVTIQSGAKFDIDDEDLAITSALSFSSSADLMPGQRIEVHPVTAVAGSPLSTTTDRVRLDSSHLTARVQSIAGSDFIVDNLPALFSNAVPAIVSIEVRTYANTEFENASSVVDVAAGDTVSIAGLLFKTGGRPVLVAEKVRKR